MAPQLNSVDESKAALPGQTALPDTGAARADGKKARRKRILKRILGILLILIILLTGAFTVYVRDYYRADETASALLTEGAGIRRAEDHLILESPAPTDTALIFYPGGKVEYHAYLPMLKDLAARAGISVILVRMPFNLAVFDADAAAAIMASYPEFTRWYIGGHSLGGAMAADYASKHPAEIAGLILLGAYRYGNYPLAATLTIYGSLNTTVAQRVDYTENVVVIPGGNHAQFGNYGPQDKDPPAAISVTEQQQIAVGAIVDFIQQKE